ncbi:hypothetical protein BDZ91DRAFT_767253 [Kalaharituber pfeilii]|nr:hypothetical protein BDZ91DRAFT_767253 [Kalaharituber pfeilii]
MASQILDLIACSRRPLKKHEIQGVFAIGDMEDRTVNFEQPSLINDIGNICGSLVEVNMDGTVQFVHTTARFTLPQAEVHSYCSKLSGNPEQAKIVGSPKSFLQK